MAEHHLGLAEQGGFDKLLGARRDLSAMVDNGGDPAVGAAQQVAAVFQGAHARHLQMLQGADGAPEPAIVADRDQQFGAARGARRQVGVGHLVADQRRHPVIGRLQGALVGRARAEVRHRQVEEVDESTQPAFEGHVLTERHQALLVVLPAALAQGHGGIVVAALRIAGGNAGNQRRVAEIRAPVYAGEKIARLIEDPRYGGLGPKHQIALEAGPYGLFVAGQYLPVIAPIPLFLQRNIGLIHRDRQRPFGGRRHPFDGAEHKPAAPEHGEQAGVADQGRRLTAAPGQKQAGGAEHHGEGQTEHPGDRRPSREPGIGVGVA